MSSYYEIHTGNLHEGDIAKSSDIMMPSKTIRQNMMSTIRASDSIWKQATATSFLPVRKPRLICCVN